MNDKLGVSLGEATTWKSLLGLLTLFGIYLKPEQAEAIATAGATFYMLIGVFWKRNPDSLLDK